MGLQVKENREEILMSHNNKIKHACTHQEYGVFFLTNIFLVLDMLPHDFLLFH